MFTGAIVENIVLVLRVNGPIQQSAAVRHRSLVHPDWRTVAFPTRT
jgi:hypothetical protein